MIPNIDRVESKLICQIAYENERIKNLKRIREELMLPCNKCPALTAEYMEDKEEKEFNYSWKPCCTQIEDDFESMHYTVNQAQANYKLCPLRQKRI